MHFRVLLPARNIRLAEIAEPARCPVKIDSHKLSAGLALTELWLLRRSSSTHAAEIDRTRLWLKSRIRLPIRLDPLGVRAQSSTARLQTRDATDFLQRATRETLPSATADFATC